MNLIKVPHNWKLVLAFSVSVLLLLDFLNFYGLYSNKFYFKKIDNYIIPLLSIVHFCYLYQFGSKIRAHELGSPQMRNLEYSLYIIALVYIFKSFDTIYILLSYWEYENSLFPITFLPVGFLILFLYVSLIGLTFLTFRYRRELIGRYLFDDMNQHVDHWN